MPVFPLQTASAGRRSEWRTRRASTPPSGRQKTPVGCRRAGRRDPATAFHRSGNKPGAGKSRGRSLTDPTFGLSTAPPSFQHADREAPSLLQHKSNPNYSANLYPIPRRTSFRTQPLPASSPENNQPDSFLAGQASRFLPGLLRLATFYVVHPVLRRVTLLSVATSVRVVPLLGCARPCPISF